MSGGDGNHLEIRVTRLEEAFVHTSGALSRIELDVRELRGFVVTGGVVLFGAIVSSHLLLRADITEHVEKLHAEDEAIVAMVESKHDKVMAKIDAITERLDAVVERLSKLEMTVAVALARDEERSAKRTDPPRTNSPSAESPERGSAVIH